MVFMGMSNFVDYRLLAILMTGMCLGLPALGWAFRSLHFHRRSGGRVTPFAACLLLSDVLELLLLSFLMVEQLNICDLKVYPCWVWFPVSVGVRLCALHFHQLVALEGIMALSFPQCWARLSSPAVGVPISVFLWLTALSFYLSPVCIVVNVVLAAVPVALLVVSFVLTLKTPPHVAPRPWDVLGVAAVTLLGVSWPTCALFFGILSGVVWLHVIFFVMQLRLITDPLLCVLVWRATGASATSSSTTRLHIPLPISATVDCDSVIRRQR
ncbi:uncharacterized protein LOC125289144 [Alosa alosa]|uniref:uncharacterized protein LOC125289144 n=1 Tax=Alosa alosa TaxID=278164 RepID=UPI00201527CE|nr:uncharacterized protein LOC125289144 [Alosa alosa]XP_048091800.1 uncharacterized protein LOC125289144 [Alosa alosa]